jgi:hypothetical protein
MRGLRLGVRLPPLDEALEPRSTDGSGRLAGARAVRVVFEIGGGAF